jgi:hypothetical protein
LHPDKLREWAEKQARKDRQGWSGRRRGLGRDAYLGDAIGGNMNSAQKTITSALKELCAELGISEAF